MIIIVQPVARPASAVPGYFSGMIGKRTESPPFSLISLANLAQLTNSADH
ncbi:hypothetical protein [Sphingopyxis sp.]|jgi:hypothetical protein